MHETRPGAAILIRLGHSIFPLKVPFSEGGTELCRAGKWAQHAKLLKKGGVSNRATAHST